MTTFDNRDKAFENKFAHDEEMLFKAMARRNKLLGLWVAGLIGKNGTDAEQYAKNIVEVSLDHTTHPDIAEYIIKDLSKAGITKTSADIHREMSNLLEVAKKQIAGDGK